MARTAAESTRRGASHPDVRSRILDAAVDLFADRGYDATSVQDVVERAGVTKGALYHYFASKDDLLFEIYQGLHAAHRSGLEQILARGEGSAATIRAIITDVVTTTATYIREADIFARNVWRVDQQRWATLQAGWRRYQDAVRAVIREGQRSGAFADSASPEVISWSIFGLTNSMPTWYRSDGPKSATEIATELADLILAGLTPASPLPTTEGNAP